MEEKQLNRSTNKAICFTHLLQPNGLCDCLLPGEKGEEGEEEELHSHRHCLCVCVVLRGRLPDLPQPVGETDRNQLRAMQRGGREGGRGRQLQRKVKWCRHSLSPGKPTLFQRNIGQWQTPAIVFGQKVTWLPKHHSLCTEWEGKKRKEKKKKKLWGWRVMKRRKIK